MRYIKLWYAFLKFSLKELAAYRSDLLFRLFSMILMMAIMYFVLSLPFEYTKEIATWSKNEVLVLISIYYMSNGLTWGLFREGISELEGLVRTGSFDGKLIKPISSDFLITFFRVDIARFADTVISGSFLVYLLSISDFEISWISLISASISFICGIWIVSRLFLIINSLSFWVTETYLDHVANPILVLAKYPVDIWPDNLKQVFYWILPVAFVSTVPTAILLNRLPYVYAFFAIILAIFWSVLAKILWNFALRSYSGSGS